MKFIADFHIHSHYSLATSKKLVPEHLEYWARIKGIDVVGTGDCVHPGWMRELSEKLEPAGNGLYRLKKEFRIIDSAVSGRGNAPGEVYFILTGEISNIYKKGKQVRKVHNLCVFSDFEAVDVVQKKLMEIGNIASDGRPILGLDSKYLLEMVLESAPKSFLIPAHIWTPWFSVLGSKSGFDSIEECYEDMTRHIFAVETGLSSDPPMNWACSFLDPFKLVSNSDAHSPEKLGREANLFDAELSYDGIYGALSGDSGFSGTIEFFPQEGKYHYDGHRKCDVCWDPLETLENRGTCSKCGRPVTLGVMYRVAELADRADIMSAANRRDFHSITSLPDLIAEIMDKNGSSKVVNKEYMRLIENIGSEFYILLSASEDELKKKGSEILAEGIARMRNGNVIIEEGYDGEFGRIKVFSKEETASFSGTSLFETIKEREISREKADLSIRFDISKFQSLLARPAGRKTQENGPAFSGATDEQKEGTEHFKGPCMVMAGPGAGKTRILTERIMYLISERNVDPGSILAVTFSNKAAAEMRDRVKIKNLSSEINISTFHAFGLSVLKEHYDKTGRPERFYIIDSEDEREILAGIASDKRGLTRKLALIEAYKQGLICDEVPEYFARYEKELRVRGVFDLNDLIYAPVMLFREYPDLLREYRNRYQWLLVDEYQDINARQYELIMLLGGDVPNLFVIGDPDQSIYGFRGSDVRFIERLRKDLPGIKLIRLQRSYRCPEPVLKMAGQVLQKSEFLDGIPDDRKIQVQSAETDASEADWIAAQIERMMGGVRSFSMDSGISDGEAFDDISSFSDFAVLCRTYTMFKPIVKAFEDHGIAYQVVGTEPFFEKEPVRSLVTSFRRIYYSHLKNEKPPDYKAIDVIRDMLAGKEKIFDILKALMLDIEIPSEDKKRLKKLVNIYGSDYDKFFLNVSTRRGVDDYESRAEAVSVMTIHASKGLEFKAVFIPGCEEGIIPFEVFGKKNQAELAEEERLFYVGITRTQKYLYLSHARKRHFKGKTLYQKKSSFLDRVEKQLIKSGRRDPKASGTGDVQMDLF